MKRVASIGLGALLVTGCVSVLPDPVVPDALYRLRAASNETAGTPLHLPMNVTVFEPEGSVLLLGHNVVFEDPNGALSLMRESQWSDSAGRLLQSLMLDRLAIRTPDSQGLALSDRSGAFTPVELRWQVRDFVVRDGDAVASFRATVLNGRKRTVIAQIDVKRIVAYKGKAHSEGVQALIQAARESVNELALQLPEQLAQIELMAESSKR